jgi:hypothetical protein
MTPQAFLASLRTGPHVLTHIHPDTHHVSSRCFARADDPDLPAFLAHAVETGAGVYFGLNPPKTDADKKTKKEDIARIEWLHVDLDPQPGVPREEARQAITDKLDSLEGDAAPSIVIDSGNGFQAMWRLDMAVPNKDGMTDRVEAINNGIAEKLGGDTGTWNIDRILRLPGTTNFPNAKKRAAGRTAAPASLVIASDTTITLTTAASLFPPIQPPPALYEQSTSIDFTAVFAVTELADLPSSTRETLATALANDSKLAALWGGDRSAIKDQSGSGVAYAISAHLHRTREFSDTEIAQLVFVNEHTSDVDKMDERYLSRVVGRTALISVR